MKLLSLSLLACPVVLVAACSSGASTPTAASGQIDVWNTAGTETINVSVVDTSAKVVDADDASSPYSAPTVTVGSCTYYPPLKPVGLPSPGEGTTSVEANAGAIAVVDGTTNATLGTYSFAPAGYTPDVGASPSSPWKSGDTLTATASGASVGAFTLSVPALSIPAITFPSTISAAKDLTLTWTPDPNAQSITIWIADNTFATSVACELADSAGTVTIAASLLASLNAKDQFTACAYRQSDATVEDKGTSIEMRSFGEMGRTAVTIE